jgi:hypothetical protein
MKTVTLHNMATARAKAFLPEGPKGYEHMPKFTESRQLLLPMPEQGHLPC